MKHKLVRVEASMETAKQDMSGELEQGHEMDTGRNDRREI